MTDAERNDLLYHLGYEWWMLRASFEALSKVEIHDPVRNALLESLCLHVRGLVYFFYVPSTRPTDWTVEKLGLQSEASAFPNPWIGNDDTKTLLIIGPVGLKAPDMSALGPTGVGPPTV